MKLSWSTRTLKEVAFRWSKAMQPTATCIIIAPKRLKLRLSGSARKSQKRFRDTPRFKFQAGLARTQPFLSRSVRNGATNPDSNPLEWSIIMQFGVMQPTSASKPFIPTLPITTISAMLARSRRIRTLVHSQHLKQKRLRGRRLPLLPLLLPPPPALLLSPLPSAWTRLQENASSLSFPYVCPEPVLVK